MPAASIVPQLIADFVVYLGLLVRRRKAIAAPESLFFVGSSHSYQERKVDPRRIDPATRITLALLSRFFNWRDALMVVHPKTLIRWHRAGFFDFFGIGNQNRAALRFLLNSRRLIREMSQRQFAIGPGEDRERSAAQALALKSRRARCASTCEGSRAADLAEISAGAPFCAITQRPSSPAISVWRSRRAFAFYTSL